MTTDHALQRNGPTGAPDKEYDMKKSAKRTAVAGIAVLMAGASIAGGASVTAAAIDIPASRLPADATLVVQQVAQDADGNWFSCEQELGGDSGVGVTPSADGGTEGASTGIMVTASAGAVPFAGGEAIPVDEALPSDVSIAANGSGVIVGIAVAEAGDDGNGSGASSGTVTGSGTITHAMGSAVEVTGGAIALPTPDQIRPGTAEECDALQGK